MTLLWTLNRLRSMSLPEIVHRVGEKAKKITAKNRLEGWARYAAPGAIPTLPELPARVAGFDGQMRAAIAQNAAHARDGKFSALGQKWPQRAPDNLFPPEIWQLDPITEKFWPGAAHYCFDIAYRFDPTLGDIKYVWEFNRLQFLQPLAAQVFFTDDARALAAIEACITSWVATNPPFRGLGWCSGIEVSLRAISLLIVTSLVGDRLEPKTISLMRATLKASLFWLHRYPSRFSSANNHLIAELAGIFLIARAMPETPNAARIASKAHAQLGLEVLRQFHPDGVPAEQSPTYGAFSAEFLLCVHGEMPLAGESFTRLQRFAAFIDALADGAGRVPAIGDDDEGIVEAFAPNHATYASDIARRIAPVHPAPPITTFHDGGYSVIRDGRWHVIFDHGPLGYLAIAAHGHADALSVSAALHGEPLLVDPGTYLYHAGREWRDWFRGTQAHNTLNIAGENQSLISGAFNWSHKAQCRLENCPAGVSASHNGYEKRFRLRHQRTVTVENSALVLHDQLIGSASPQQAEITFQLAEGLAAYVDANSVLISKNDIPWARTACDTPGEWHIFTGTPPEQGGGWVSPSFGFKHPAPRVVWRGRMFEGGVRSSVIAL